MQFLSLSEPLEPIKSTSFFAFFCPFFSDHVTDKSACVEYWNLGTMACRIVMNGRPIVHHHVLVFFGLFRFSFSPMPIEDETRELFFKKSCQGKLFAKLDSLSTCRGRLREERKTGVKSQWKFICEKERRKGTLLIWKTTKNWGKAELKSKWKFQIETRVWSWCFKKSTRWYSLVWHKKCAVLLSLQIKKNLVIRMFPTIYWSTFYFSRGWSMLFFSNQKIVQTRWENNHSVTNSYFRNIFEEIGFFATNK